MRKFLKNHGTLVLGYWHLISSFISLIFNLELGYLILISSFHLSFIHLSLGYLKLISSFYFPKISFGIKVYMKLLLRLVEKIQYWYLVFCKKMLSFLHWWFECSISYSSSSCSALSTGLAFPLERLIVIVQSLNVLNFLRAVLNPFAHPKEVPTFVLTTSDDAYNFSPEACLHCS